MIDASILLYGPSGSGKSTAGAVLAQALDLPFVDLDREIERACGMQVSQIFDTEGEAAFRSLEVAHLSHLLKGGRKVIALGGGALTNLACRTLAEELGQVLLLNAHAETLCARLQADSEVRPLLAGNCLERLKALLARRREHYASFPLAVDTTLLTPAETAWEVQRQLGCFRIHSVEGAKTRRAGQEAYDVIVEPGCLDTVGKRMQARGLHGPVVVVCDSHTSGLFGERVLASLREAGYSACLAEFPAGEAHKRIETAARLWDTFLSAGMERRSTALALGGGVVTDMVGFAAAAYLRGVRWVALPTSLLGMVDASTGGKTGIDLAQGKNLVGAFHSPALVLADPLTLKTLPMEELRSGLAETLKHGVIADPVLFEACKMPVTADLVRRAVAVKAQVVEVDPFEQGVRATLNYGHTIGHAIEQVSGFRLRHGEAVAVGMVIEARLAETLRIAEYGVSEKIETALARIGLPVAVPPGLDLDLIMASMNRDKKKSGGKVKFALPVKIGEVKYGIEIDEDRVKAVIRAGTAWSEPEPAGCA
ncbi:MAG TPA: 3-dehydroquinate synthase [Anaerolineaceae bacterium]